VDPKQLFVDRGAAHPAPLQLLYIDPEAARVWKVIIARALLML